MNKVLIFLEDRIVSKNATLMFQYPDSLQAVKLYADLRVMDSDINHADYITFVSYGRLFDSFQFKGMEYAVSRLTRHIGGICCPIKDVCEFLNRYILAYKFVQYLRHNGIRFKVLSRCSLVDHGGHSRFVVIIDDIASMDVLFTVYTNLIDNCGILGINESFLRVTFPGVDECTAYLEGFPSGYRVYNDSPCGVLLKCVVFYRYKSIPHNGIPYIVYYPNCLGCNLLGSNMSMMWCCGRVVEGSYNFISFIGFNENIEFQATVHDNAYAYNMMYAVERRDIPHVRCCVQMASMVSFYNHNYLLDGRINGSQYGPIRYVGYYHQRDGMPPLEEVDEESSYIESSSFDDDMYYSPEYYDNGGYNSWPLEIDDWSEDGIDDSYFMSNVLSHLTDIVD